MSRVSQEPRLPIVGSPNYDTNLYVQLTKLFREFASQLNSLSEGKIQAVTNSGTAAPTAGTYAQGDKVWHSAPVEAGSAGNKYVVIGYVCVAAGTPGTWLPMRVLTGN
jgi:hypothetical protein